MVSTVLAVSLPMLLIEPVNNYTCKTWLSTETVDSSISPEGSVGYALVC